MLAIRAESKTRTNQSHHNGITNINRVTSIGRDTTALSLAGLGLLVGIFTGALLLLGLSLALQALGLGGSLHVLLEEVWIDGLDVGGVNVDEGGGAFRFILVDAAYIGGATIGWLVWDAHERGKVGCKSVVTYA